MPHDEPYASADPQLELARGVSPRRSAHRRGHPAGEASGGAGWFLPAPFPAVSVLVWLALTALPSRSLQPITTPKLTLLSAGTALICFDPALSAER